MRPEQKKIYYN